MYNGEKWPNFIHFSWIFPTVSILIYIIVRTFTCEVKKSFIQRLAAGEKIKNKNREKRKGGKEKAENSNHLSKGKPKFNKISMN